MNKQKIPFTTFLNIGLWLMVFSILTMSYFDIDCLYYQDLIVEYLKLPK